MCICWRGHESKPLKFMKVEKKQKQRKTAFSIQNTQAYLVHFGCFIFPIFVHVFFFLFSHSIHITILRTTLLSNLHQSRFFLLCPHSSRFRFITSTSECLATLLRLSVIRPIVFLRTSLDKVILNFSKFQAMPILFLHTMCVSLCVSVYGKVLISIFTRYFSLCKTMLERSVETKICCCFLCVASFVTFQILLHYEKQTKIKSHAQISTWPRIE